MIIQPALTSRSSLHQISHLVHKVFLTCLRAPPRTFWVPLQWESDWYDGSSILLNIMQSYSVITEITTLFLEEKIKSQFNSKNKDKKKEEKNRKSVVKSLLHLICFQLKYAPLIRYTFSNTTLKSSSWFWKERKYEKSLRKELSWIWVTVVKLILSTNDSSENPQAVRFSNYTKICQVYPHNYM